MLQTTSVILVLPHLSLMMSALENTWRLLYSPCDLHMREQFINVHKNGATGGKGFCTAFILH